jgi:pimeloyl-ACP methyl ester carboxylesterase
MLRSTAHATEPADRSSDAAGVFETLTERIDWGAFDVPTGHAVVRLEEEDGTACDVRLVGRAARVVPPVARRPDAVLTADARTWSKIAADLSSGMAAYHGGRLRVRGNLHVGVGFLAATAPATGGARLRFVQQETSVGTVSLMLAGKGEPVLFMHGLGTTKASFLPSIAALADHHRCIAMDLPGFGDSDKPVFAPYDPAFFSKWAIAVLDALHIRRAHIVGHSLGGRAAIELGLQHPERVRSLVLMMPSLAWRRDRPWATWLRLVRPELGVLQLTPRLVVQRFLDWLIPDTSGWAAAGKDEFLRSFMVPSGRAAFYAAARMIYLEEPDGPRGFWSRLSGLAVPSLFIWGRHDRLVPLAFQRHVAQAVPESRHLELACGHVPQLECPRQLHGAIRRFLG